MKALVPMLVVALGLLILVGGAVFVVDETQQVVITMFGDPVGEPITDPGVHFKLPFVQTAHFFEKRFLEWNGDPNEVPTRDKRFVDVDTYARWRITDPLLFFQRVQNERGALTRLDDIIDGETRNAVANHDVVEVVRSTNRDVQIDRDLAEEEQTTNLASVTVGRLGIIQIIAEKAQARAVELGIEILDVRFKRINYNDQVRRTVFQRMIAERQRIAERFRSEGLGQGARIRGEKERELKTIESGAYRQAQEIVGRADAEATTIYAEAFGRDPEFYRFFKTMETYVQTVDKDTWLILTTEGDFFSYLDSAGRK